jgi:hypothetical protein
MHKRGMYKRSLIAVVVVSVVSAHSSAEAEKVVSSSMKWAQSVD